MRKPIIVEITGTPEAGKTTACEEIKKQLEKLGYKVKIYPEASEESKKIFPKNSPEAKLWMDITTIANSIQAPFLDQYDIIIFDRGNFDRLFWIYLNSVYDFKTASKHAPLIHILTDHFPDLLLVFKVSVDEALRRRGGEGSLVTRDFLETYNSLLDVFINSSRINKEIICTDNKSVDEVAKIAVNYILDNMKEP